MARPTPASATIPPRDADATRRRLLDAAREEFARYGIAGARVDRIADESRSNKAQIYHYFGSKDQLFDAVFDEMVQHTLSEAPIDTDDLPEYAARLYDGYVADPSIQRLATWYRLERADGADLIPIVVSANAGKLEAVERAQRAGTLPERYSAAELLGLIIHIAAFWSSGTPEYDAVLADIPAERRRQLVGDAVRALLRT